MRASAWSATQLSGEDQVCRTLAGVGDLAPDEDAPSWSFHLGLPDSLGKPRTTHLANGYVLEFPHLAEPPRFACLAVDRGILVASTSLDLRPTLFSPGQAVDEDGEDQWLRLEDQTILLRVKKGDEGTQFVLCVGQGTDDVIEQMAGKGFETDLEALAQKEFSLRSAFWMSLQEVEGDFSLLADAVEDVVFHLEAPVGSYTHRWSAAQIPEARRFELNQLYPLVQTWQDLDPAVAHDLVAGALTAVASDGSLAASFVPDQESSRSAAAAWPYLARSVQAVGDSALAAGAVESIRKNLNGSIQTYDPSRTGFLCWRTAEEAFVPDAFDEQMASPALSGFMLSELEALENLLSQAGDESGLGDLLLDARESIHAQLESSLWDEEHQIYRDRYVAGPNTSRATLSGVMPLGWDPLPANRRSALVASLESPTFFGDPNGVTLWEEWENDPTPPPVPAGYQFLLLEGLRHEADLEVKKRLQDRIAGAIVRHAQNTQTFPTQLQTSAQIASGDPAGETGIQAPVIGACLALDVLQNVYRRSDDESTSKFWVVVDRHRMKIMAAVIGIPALLVIGSALNLARKPSAQRSAPPQTTGLVAELMRQGNLAEALQLLEEAPDEIAAGSMWLTRAAIYFRMENYEDAEREYRAMIAKDFQVPSASINLALTLFKKGQFEEASQLYKQCSEDFALSHPEITKRAQEASRFMRLYRDTLVRQK